MNEQLYDIPLDDILVDEEFNCRGRITPIECVDLARDIEKNGMIQPVVVMEDILKRKPWRLVAGFRRAMAHKILKAMTIKARIIPVISESAAVTMNLAENLKRKDLNILQEARTVARLEGFGLKEQEIANELGTSRGWVQVRSMLLTLPTEIQEAAATGLFSQVQIREMYQLVDPREQLAAAKRIKESKMRGEDRMPNISKNKPSAHKKVHRKRSEILQVLDFLMDKKGGNVGTRCLAWCAGEISLHELFASLNEYYTETAGRSVFLTEFESYIGATGGGVETAEDDQQGA